MPDHQAYAPGAGPPGPGKISSSLFTVSPDSVSLYPTVHASPTAFRRVIEPQSSSPRAAYNVTFGGPATSSGDNQKEEQVSGNVKPIPEGFHTVTPHIVCRDASRAIEFYKKAFGAEELGRMKGPDGKSIMHAVLKIGDSRIMLCDEFPDMHCLSPAALNGTPVGLHLYVRDTDAAFQQAVAAGATPTMPPQDMFWGDRYGRLKDPFGHEWSIGTHKQDLSPAEMAKAAATACAKKG